MILHVYKTIITETIVFPANKQLIVCYKLVLYLSKKLLLGQILLKWILFDSISCFIDSF